VLTTGGTAIFTVKCPKCEKPLEAPAHAVGKKVQCVCGHKFLFQDRSGGKMAGRIRDANGPSVGRARRKADPWLIVGIGLVAGGLLVFALVAAVLWVAMHGGKNGAFAAEKPAVDAKVLAEKESLLQDAEQRLVELRDTNRRARRLILVQLLQHIAAPEFADCIPDFVDGKPVAAQIESVMQKAAEADRNLSPSERQDKLEERTGRKERFLILLKSFRHEIDDPNSELSLKLKEGIETLDTTKQLREQERLIEPLRQEVKALKDGN
jgi:hypothetical protein